MLSILIVLIYDQLGQIGSTWYYLD